MASSTAGWVLVLLGTPPRKTSVDDVLAGLRACGRHPALPVLLLADGAGATAGDDDDEAVLETGCGEDELRRATKRLLGRGP